MSRVRVKNTKPEIMVQSALRKVGLKYKKHVKKIPGNPDLVFPSVSLVVFIDGDFWHGYRFPVWARSLNTFWKKKINENRRRDQRNFRKLRRKGWKVLRVWDHQIKKDLPRVVEKIIARYRI
jgi:DNA mismatch endonuclease (patch repair protein)